MGVGEGEKGIGVDVDIWEVGMKGGMMRKRNKLMVGGWGRGKWFLRKEVVGE